MLIFDDRQSMKRKRTKLNIHFHILVSTRMTALSSSPENRFQAAVMARSLPRLIADKMLKAFTAAIRLAKTSRDFLDSVKILKEMAVVLQLDKEEIMELEEDLMKQIQVPGF